MFLEREEKRKLVVCFNVFLLLNYKTGSSSHFFGTKKKQTRRNVTTNQNFVQNFVSFPFFVVYFLFLYLCLSF